MKTVCVKTGAPLTGKSPQGDSAPSRGEISRKEIRPRTLISRGAATSLLLIVSGLAAALLCALTWGRGSIWLSPLICWWVALSCFTGGLITGLRGGPRSLVAGRPDWGAGRRPGDPVIRLAGSREPGSRRSAPLRFAACRSELCRGLDWSQ